VGRSGGGRGSWVTRGGDTGLREGARVWRETRVTRTRAADRRGPVDHDSVRGEQGGVADRRARQHSARGLLRFKN
jgi:hypothetical protein